jgi:hypothetical protein
MLRQQRVLRHLAERPVGVESGFHGNLEHTLGDRHGSQFPFTRRIFQPDIKPPMKALRKHYCG